MQKRFFNRGILSLVLSLILLLVLSLQSFTVGKSAQAASVKLPTLYIPFDAHEKTPITFSSAPHGWKGQSDPQNPHCYLEPISIMSGLDFGTNNVQNVHVETIAAGTVVYINNNYDNDLRGVVIVDHGPLGNGLDFFSQYWHLNAAAPGLQVGQYVFAGTYIGDSGYEPTPNGNSVHLHLEFSEGLSSLPAQPGFTPYSLTPYPANGMKLDGYRFWSITDPASGKGYNYQGTATQGTIKVISATYDQFDAGQPCGSNSVNATVNSDGTYIDAGASTQLVSHNTLAKWHRVSISNMMTQGRFTGVTGTSSSDVWVVGENGQAPVYGTGYANHWNGKAWASYAIANMSYPLGVSSFGKEVWVAGYQNSSSAAAYWNKTNQTWVATTPQRAEGNDFFFSITGTSHSNVWAVGATGYNFNGPWVGLIEYWNGSQWSAPYQITLPFNATSWEFYSVEAYSATDVWTVGYAATANGSQSLTYHYNGTSWQYVQTPTKATDVFLTSVSISANDDVYAAGYIYQTGAYAPYLLQWNSTSNMWQEMSNPNGCAVTGSMLPSISVVSNNNLWFVSSCSANGFHIVAAHWDGIQWTTIPLASINGTAESTAIVSYGGEAWTTGFTDGGSFGNPPDLPVVQHFS